MKPQGTGGCAPLCTGLLVCALGHRTALTGVWREGAEKEGAGGELESNAFTLSDSCKAGLNHSVQGMSIFRAFQVKEVAPEGAWGPREGWEQRATEKRYSQEAIHQHSATSTCCSVSDK